MLVVQKTLRNFESFLRRRSTTVATVLTRRTSERAGGEDTSLDVLDALVPEPDSDDDRHLVRDDESRADVAAALHWSRR